MKRILLLTTLLAPLSACGNQVGLDSDPKRSAAVKASDAKPSPTAVVPEDEGSGEQPGPERVAPAIGEVPILGEVPVLEVRTEELPVKVDEPELPMEVNEPQLVTGAYLSACMWAIHSVKLSCSVKTSDDITRFNMNQFSISILRAAGDLYPADKFKVIRQEAPTQVTFTVTFVEVTSNLIVRIEESLGAAKNEVAEFASKDIPLIKANITAFAGINFTGISREFGEGNYTQVISFADFPTSFASIRIPPNMAIEGCEALTSGRICRSYYGDISDLSDMRGRFNTLRVFTSLPFITVFSSGDHIGNTAPLLIGTPYPNPQIPAGVRDQVSSMHIAPNLVVRGCVNADGTDCLDYFPGTINVGARNDALKYFLISPLFQ